MALNGKPGMKRQEGPADSLQAREWAEEGMFLLRIFVEGGNPTRRWPISGSWGGSVGTDITRFGTDPPETGGKPDQGGAPTSTIHND